MAVPFEFNQFLHCLGSKQIYFVGLSTDLEEVDVLVHDFGLLFTSEWVHRGVDVATNHWQQVARVDDFVNLGSLLVVFLLRLVLID